MFVGTNLETVLLCFLSVASVMLSGHLHCLMCALGPVGSWGWRGRALNLCNPGAWHGALQISNDKECSLGDGHCQRRFFQSLSEAQNQSFLLPPQTHTFGPGIDWKTWKSMAGCLDTNMKLWECVYMRQSLPFWELQFFSLLIFFSEREWKFVLLFVLIQT